MGKFISVPGMRPSGGEGRMNSDSSWRKLPRNPKATEYYKSRAENSGKFTGFSPGEEITFNGDAAKVEGEEYDHNSGTIEQRIIRSSATGSGSYKRVWEKVDDKTLVIRESPRNGRVFD